MITETTSYLSVDEAAHYLGLSRHTIYAYISGRKIPFAKIGARVVLSSIDLDHWVNGHKVEPVGRG